MENIISNVGDIKFDVEQLPKNQTSVLPISVPRMHKGTVPICKYFLLPIGCKKNNLCPFRHIRNIVCKHWLKGLCKNEENCEYLHKYDVQKIPECFFYSKYKSCLNKDCKFLHTKPEERTKDCSWFERGFCKNGPYCKHRHIKKTLCENYFAGFCPLGPKCENGHPKHKISVISNGAAVIKSDVKVITCTFCGNNGHNASHCYKMKSTNADKLPQIGILHETKFKPLAEVTCYKCGEKGHYANKCTKRHTGILP